jgi:hypothetical protein
MVTASYTGTDIPVVDYRRPLLIIVAVFRWYWARGSIVG